MQAITAFEALQSPAAERNKEPLRKVLAPLLPAQGRLLEVASGALQHALHIAPQHPGLHWQCTEYDTRVLTLAPAYIEALGERWPANVQGPMALDATETPWDHPNVDVIYTANLLHIAPFTVTEALFEQAAQRLLPGGLLLIYGPFRRNSQFSSQEDAAFDASLRARNPLWGIRALETLDSLAQVAGLVVEAPVRMPANNWLLAFRQER
ncbi:MAG: DUF938 domain-containing protein [Pseudomonadales bacterium]